MTIDEYVAAVRRELGAGPHGDALAELRAQLDELAAENGEAEACRLLGDPRQYAANLRAEVGDEAEPPRVLGMPNTLGDPAPGGWRSMFDPTNPNVMIPKVHGIGWTINFGAVAVKLHLIRPDDLGDDVLAQVRGRDIALGFAVPALLVALTGSVAAWGIAHRDVVPTHWGLTRPDQFTSAATAFGGVLVIAGGAAVALGAGAAVACARRAVLAASALAGLATWVTALCLTIAALMLGGDRPVGWVTVPAVVVAAVLGAVVGFLPIRLALPRVWRDHRKDAA